MVGRLFGDGGGRGSSTGMAVAEAPLRGRRRSAVGRLDGGCTSVFWVDLNRVGGKRRGLAHFNLNEVTRSARMVGALRVILPVAHGEMMRYGYVRYSLKKTNLCKTQAPLYLSGFG
jgi:hypothetical protein